jgi:hypothetical protein
MSLADKNQIMFTKDAYQQLVDMVDDPNLVDRFVEFKKLRIKHDLEVDVYQYIGEREPYISPDPPANLSLMKRADEAMDKLVSLGFPMPRKDSPDIGLKGMIGMMEGMANVFSNIQPEPKQIIDIKKDDDSK